MTTAKAELPVGTVLVCTAATSLRAEYFTVGKQYAITGKHRNTSKPYTLVDDDGDTVNVGTDLNIVQFHTGCYSFEVFKQPEKFEVGDLVVYKGTGHISIDYGDVLEVRNIRTLSGGRCVMRTTTGYIVDARYCRKLGTCTPTEAFQRLLEDKPTQVYHCGAWQDITQDVSIHFLKSVQCRPKPECITIGDTEVVKPVPPDEVIEGQVYYTINVREGAGTVESVQGCKGARFLWQYREDAYTALTGISGIFDL